MKKLILTSILICISFCSALATQLAGGSDFSFVLKNDGALWAWGGMGMNDYGLIPTQVSGLTDVISIDSYAGHSLVLKRDGTVWAWGDNLWGQLGDGTKTSRSTPGQVVGLSGVIAIAGGRSHSLAVKNDGTVWAWGLNQYGQLGDGNGGGYDANYSTVPVQAIGFSHGMSKLFKNVPF